MMADGGFGVTIAFASGFMGEIVGVELQGMQRGVTQTTHSTSTNGWRTFKPSDLKDPGGLRVRLRFDPNDTPPIDSAAETVTVTLPVPEGLTNGATIAGTGFMTDFTASIDCVGEDAMEASCTIKYSGALTWTDAS